MTKNGKLTKVDYVKTIVDNVLPLDPGRPWTANLRLILSTALMSSASCYCTRNVLKAICSDAGWAEYLKDMQDAHVAKVNIARELAMKRPICA